jgi:hypothetical protein
MFEIGRRSPFNSRFTEKDGVLFPATPAPAVGSPKSGRKPRKKTASAVATDAPAIRIMRFAIGPLRRADAITPTIDQAHENPRANHTIRVLNVLAQHTFHCWKAKVRISIFPPQIMRNGNWWEQKWRLALVLGERPFLSPSPVLGRS